MNKKISYRLVLPLWAVLLFAIPAHALPALPDFLENISQYVQQTHHPAILIALALFLPVIGFPITLFLVALGVQFGGLFGILSIYAILPVHLLITYGLAHSFFRPIAKRLLSSRFQELPQVPENRQGMFSFIFMLTPGLPYTIKNFILALSGVSFGHYFLIAWLVQATMAIPIILLGHAVSRINFYWIVGIVAVVPALWLLKKGAYHFFTRKKDGDLAEGKRPN